MKKVLTIMLAAAMALAVMVPPAAAAEEEGSGTSGLVELYDKDGDGKVSKDEFPGPDRAFGFIDRNNDGYVSRSEARSVPPPGETKGGGHSGGNVPDKFYEDDHDGDKQVSREEFSGPPEMFDRLDLNGDGYIQEDEVKTSTRSNMPEDQASKN